VLSYLLDPNCCVVLTFANRLATSRCCSLVGQQLWVVSADAIVELAAVLYRKDYSRFSRRGEREADSSNLKKGFGVTNFCWLPTSVGMFGY
jgi:hypothetical protein